MTSSKSCMMNLVKSKIPEFIRFLREYKGSSEKSVKTYEGVLYKAQDLLEIVEDEDKITIDLMQYRAEIASQSKTTIAKKVSIIRSYLDWLKENETEHIKIKNDLQVKIPKKLPKPVKTSYIQEALKEADEIEKMALLMLYTLGLRISELCEIKLSDINDEWIKVFGKGSKERLVPVLPELKQEIDKFVKLYGVKEYLFEIESMKLSENQLRYKIDNLFKKIGIKVTPHQLRHSFATDLLNGGARITDVSELLGHSALSTTEIYTKLSSKLKLQNYLNAHPLCKDS